MPRFLFNLRYGENRRRLAGLSVLDMVRVSDLG